MGNITHHTAKTPIMRLVDDQWNITDKTVIRVSDSPGQDKTIIDEFLEQRLNTFGGRSVRLIYDADEKLVQVNSEGSETKLIYDINDEYELDHIETRIPGKSMPYIRTNLDYMQDEERKLENVYSEIIE